MNNGFVCVVESPSPHDLMSGRIEGKALCENFALSGIPFIYTLAVNRELFSKALREGLAQESNKFPGKIPIIHLSAHANSEGLGLTSGEFLSWSDLNGVLSELQ